jgi:hypothetical protein
MTIWALATRDVVDVGAIEVEVEVDVEKDMDVEVEASPEAEEVEVAALAGVVSVEGRSAGSPLQAARRNPVTRHEAPRSFRGATTATVAIEARKRAWAGARERRPRSFALAGVVRRHADSSRGGVASPRWLIFPTDLFPAVW